MQTQAYKASPPSPKGLSPHHPECLPPKESSRNTLFLLALSLIDACCSIVYLVSVAIIMTSEFIPTEIMIVIKHFLTVHWMSYFLIPIILAGLVYYGFTLWQTFQKQMDQFQQIKFTPKDKQNSPSSFLLFFYTISRLIAIFFSLVSCLALFHVPMIPKIIYASIISILATIALGCKSYCIITVHEKNSASILSRIKNLQVPGSSTYFIGAITWACYRFSQIIAPILGYPSLVMLPSTIGIIGLIILCCATEWHTYQQYKNKSEDPLCCLFICIGFIFALLFLPTGHLVISYATCNLFHISTQTPLVQALEILLCVAMSTAYAAVNYFESTLPETIVNLTFVEGLAITQQQPTGTPIPTSDLTSSHCEPINEQKNPPQCSSNSPHTILDHQTIKQ
jgi:hypothetical protein